MKIKPTLILPETWAFTDKELGLENELLVFGADRLCDRICAELHIKPERGFTAVFEDYERYLKEPSKEAPPPSSHQSRRLTLLGEAENGYTYLYGTEAVWLCANLLKYFDTPPKTIAFYIEEEMAIYKARLLAAKNGYRFIYSSDYSVIEPLLKAEHLEELDDICMLYPSVDWLNYHLIS